ncbi:MAG: DUF2855 family protein [Parasphingorhabdus sp.]|nr:DUF2855 family protein [Parasphingorhabdus sp.]
MAQQQSLDLQVDRESLAGKGWVARALPPLGDGQVLFAVQKFALTANNISYASTGNALGYWEFFPSGADGAGIVPAWGFVEAIETQHPDIAVGDRFYGYVPMASHFIAQPGSVSANGFTDAAEHRAERAVIYNQYQRVTGSDAAAEDFQALIQPLFTTSFLIENFFRAADWYDASSVVMTSASSKTALGLALVCRNHSPQIRRIGLTSSGNVEFTQSTGFYDEVVAYDDLDRVNASAAVAVDFAGNRGLLAQIHAHWGDALNYSMLVGATHVGAGGRDTVLSGPKPTFFFAPTAAQALIGDIGMTAFRDQLGQSFADFRAAFGQHMTIEQLDNPADIAAAYGEMLAGDVKPDRGLICRL